MIDLKSRADWEQEANRLAVDKAVKGRKHPKTEEVILLQKRKFRKYGKNKKMKMKTYAGKCDYCGCEMPIMTNSQCLANILATQICRCKNER